MTRPSPSSSANSTGVGKNRRGNDGLMYTVAETRAGQRRWVLTDTSRLARAAMRTCRAFHLRPTFVYMAGGEPDISPGPTHAAALRKQKLDFGSARATGVVWSSLSGIAPSTGVSHHVKSLRWDAAARAYEVVICCADAKAMRATAQEMADNYGDQAADTWMEGGISVNRHYELNLELVAA